MLEHYENLQQSDIFCPHKEIVFICYKEEYCEDRIDKLVKVLFGSGIVKDKKVAVIVRNAFSICLQNFTIRAKKGNFF